MRAKTVQIVWHGKEPVYSVDFHPDGTLFTAGADKEIKAWEVTRGEDGYASVTHVSTLTGHSKTVNCVRFSPSGSHLVSSGDGGEMLLWAPADADAPRGNLCADDGGAAAGWRRAALLRGHTDDVMDVAWAADGTALLSGSIDNKAILWEVSDKRRGAMVATFANHKHFVQGVAWDPAQQFVVTQSADRTCRVYALRPPAAGKRTKVSQYMQPACDLGKDFYCAHTLAKRVVAPPAPAPAPGAATGAAPAPDAKPERHPLFQDEAVPSFFRRLAWSPDGAFLAAPAGLHRAPGSPKEVHTAYIYARGRWAAPVAHLPAQTKPVVAVRFCPVVYRRAPGAAPPPAPFDQLPYTLVFAVATLDSVIVYDTASPLPLAVLGQLHYDSITDLAWARDGRYLAVASRDCYCSIAAFDPGELGDPAAPEDLPAHIAKRVFGAADQAAAAAQASPARAQAAPAAAMPAPAVAAAAAARLETGAAPPPAAGPKPARRIQPEPVGPDAAAKRGKRIVPEEIGPLAAVVGDSQGGSAFAAAVDPAAPATKKPKRVTPVLVQPGAATPPAAAQPAANPPAGGKADAAAAAAAAAAVSAPGQSGGGAKGAKRITPNRIDPAGGGAQQRFEHAPEASAAAAAAPAEPPREEGAVRQPRRITPIPLAADQPLPEPAPAKAPAPPPSKGFSIADMARAAGQQAARQAKQ